MMNCSTKFNAAIIAGFVWGCATAQEAKFPIIITEPDIITAGPDRGAPSPNGNCVGSGCSSTADGSPFGANRPADERVGFPGASTDGGNFKLGSLDYGPIWGNGGYIGEALGRTSLAGGDLSQIFIFAQTQALLAATPDNIFPRKKIVDDWSMLVSLQSAFAKTQLVTRFPTFSAVLPPAIDQIAQIANDQFEKKFGPLRDGGRIHTDWDAWRSRLIAQTIPMAVETAEKRDLVLSEKYVAALELQIAFIKDNLPYEISFSGAPTRLRDVKQDERRVSTLRHDAEVYKLQTLREDILLRSTPEDEAATATTSLYFNRRTATDQFNRLSRRSALASVTGIQGGIAKMLADFAIAHGMGCVRDDDLAEAAATLRIAEALLDLAMKSVPLIGEGATIYEAITGTSIINGETLPAEDRILAAVTASTLLKDISKSAGLRAIEQLRIRADVLLGGKLEQTIASYAPHEPLPVAITAVYQGREINEASLIVRTKQIHDRERFRIATLEYEPPWDPGSFVGEGVLDAPVSVIRFHSKSSPVGQWFALPAEATALGAGQAAVKYNLPSAPKFSSRGILPAGTKVRVGTVGPNKFGFSTGSHQIEVVDSVDIKWFQTPPKALDTLPVR
jgi:hypothetical protein